MYALQLPPQSAKLGRKSALTQLILIPHLQELRDIVQSLSRKGSLIFNLYKTQLGMDEADSRTND